MRYKRLNSFAYCYNVIHFFFLQTHEDVRNFLCPHEGCGKSFKRLLHLKEHSAIHLGEHRPKVPYLVPVSSYIIPFVAYICDGKNSTELSFIMFILSGILFFILCGTHSKRGWPPNEWPPCIVWLHVYNNFSAFQIACRKCNHTAYRKRDIEHHMVTVHGAEPRFR